SVNYGKQIINEIINIDRKTILFRIPSHRSMLPLDNDMKALIIIKENNIFLSQFDFIYIRCIKINNNN
ncbi:unnamed protein product, partial [Rotaria sp. Silwood2]